MKCPSCGEKEDNGLVWCDRCEKKFQEMIRVFERVFIRHKRVW